MIQLKLVEIFFITSLVFLVSFFIHFPNTASSYYYSDIVSIYNRHEVNAQEIPYIQYQLEYPVLTGLVIYLGSLTGSSVGFYIFIAACLYTSVLASVYFLYKILDIYKKPFTHIVSFCAFSLSFIFLSVYSFDWIGIAFSLASIYFFLKKSYLYSSIFLGIAVAARIIPIIMLPVFILNLKSKRNIVEFLLISLFVWLLLNSFFIGANFYGWLQTYQFQYGWGIEQSWMIYILPRIGPLSHYATIILLVIFTGLLIRLKLYKNVINGLFFMFLAFMISSYKVPPQYFLMLLPFFTIVEIDKKLFYLADFLNVLILLFFFTSFFSLGDALARTSPVQLINLSRQLVLLIVLSILLKSKFPHMFSKLIK